MDSTPSPATRILVVDDSPTSLAFSERTLKNAGFEVITADHVWIAPQVATFEPHLILLDCDMGGTRGSVALEGLRKWHAMRHIPIVYHSSLSATQLADLAEETGADGFILKTGDPDSLLAQVTAFLVQRPPQERRAQIAAQTGGLGS